MTEPTPHSPIPPGYAVQQAKNRATWGPEHPATPKLPDSYPFSEMGLGGWGPPGRKRPSRKGRLFGWGSVLYWVAVTALLIADLSMKWDSGGQHPTAAGIGAYFAIAAVPWLVVKVARRRSRRRAGATAGSRVTRAMERAADKYGSASSGAYQQMPPAAAPPMTAGHNAYINAHGSAAANQQINSQGGSSLA